LDFRVFAVFLTFFVIFFEKYDEKSYTRLFKNETVVYFLKSEFSPPDMSRLGKTCGGGTKRLPPLRKRKEENEHGKERKITHQRTDFVLMC
jgi:hypothetical protein